MAKHARILTDEQRQRRMKNRQTLVEVISGGGRKHDPLAQGAGMTVILERFVHDQTTGAPVPFDGETGVERILAELGRTYEGGQVFLEGHLVGIVGILGIEGHEQPIELKATVGCGSQLRLEVGPSEGISSLLDAIAVFDRQLYLACRAVGRPVDLVAQGYDPAVSSPSDVVPVPLSKNVLLGTYLARTGRYSRDALRCTAATYLRLPVGKGEPEAVDDYRIFSALAPVLAFLTDNTLTMRGVDPRSCPRMARSLVWGNLDPARCGLVPGSFAHSFGFEAYERWVEDLRPIFFSSDTGVTFSTGTDSCKRVIEERDLSAEEAVQLLQTALPYVRWDGSMQLGMADALPPRQMGGLAALVKGLLATELTRVATHELIGLERMSDEMVQEAWQLLRDWGWEARVYGRPIGQIADELAAIASRGLAERDERLMLDELAQLWEVRVTPRDMLLANWERHREPTPDERAMELYGEGAVIPFEELEGEPPAGSTAVMSGERIARALEEQADGAGQGAGPDGRS